MITPYLAYQIRTEMGCLLNPNAEFSNQRLKEIAIEMDSLNKQMDKLDNEIKELFLNATFDS